MAKQVDECRLAVFNTTENNQLFQSFQIIEEQKDQFLTCTSQFQFGLESFQFKLFMVFEQQYLLLQDQHYDAALILYDAESFVSVQKVNQAFGFLTQHEIPVAQLICVQLDNQKQRFGQNLTDDFHVREEVISSFDSVESIFSGVAKSLKLMSNSLNTYIADVQKQKFDSLVSFDMLFLSNIYRILNDQVDNYIDYLVEHEQDIDSQFVTLILTKLATSGVNTIYILKSMLKNQKYVDLDFDILPQTEVFNFLMQCFEKKIVFDDATKKIIVNILTIQKHSKYIQQQSFDVDGFLTYLLNIHPLMIISVIEQERFEEVFLLSLSRDLKIDYRQIETKNIDVFLLFLYQKNSSEVSHVIVRNIMSCRLHKVHVCQSFIKSNIAILMWVVEIAPEVLDDQFYVQEICNANENLIFSLLLINKSVRMQTLTEAMFKEFVTVYDQFQDQIDISLFDEEVVGKLILFIKRERPKIKTNDLLEQIFKVEKFNEYVIGKLIFMDRKLVDWLQDMGIPIYREVHSFLQEQKLNNSLQKQKDKYDSIIKEKERQIAVFKQENLKLQQSMQNMQDVVFYKNEKITNVQEQYEKLLKQLEILNKQQSQTMQSGQISSDAMRILHSISQFLFNTTLTLMKQLKPPKPILQIDYQVITKKAFEDYYNTEKVVGKGDLGTSYVVTELANPLNYYLMKEIEDINLVQRDKNFNKLSHPNIITYFKEFKQGRFIQIICELIQGASIKQIIRSKGGYIQDPPIQYLFTPKQIAHILKQVSSALFHAHKEQKVIHHDLKPDNILLQLYDPENFYGVKIIDFGFNRQYQFSSSTIDNQQRYLYYPPEIVLCNASHSFSTDIWAFGCILYELCTLKILAIDVMSQLRQEKRSVQETYQEMYKLITRIQLPKGYEMFQQQLSLCLQERPEKRPSADQLAKDWFALFLQL